MGAGAHLALHPLGMWWAATSLDAWPDSGDSASAEVGKVLEEFDLSTRWGDRRQELVFIGIGTPTHAGGGVRSANTHAHTHSAEHVCVCVCVCFRACCRA